MAVGLSFKEGKVECLNQALKKPGKVVLLVFMFLFLAARIASYFFFPNFLASSGLFSVILLVFYILLFIFTIMASYYNKNTTAIRNVYRFVGIASIILGVVLISGNVGAFVVEIFATSPKYDIFLAVCSMLVSVVAGVGTILFGISLQRVAFEIKMNLTTAIKFYSYPFNALFVVSFIISTLGYAGSIAMNYLLGVGGQTILSIVLNHVPWLFTFAINLNQPLKFYFEMGDILLNFVLIALFFSYAMNFFTSMKDLESIKAIHGERIVVKEVIKEKVVVKEVVKEAPKTAPKEKKEEKKVEPAPAPVIKETTPVKEKTEAELNAYYNDLVKDGFLSKEDKELRLKAITSK